MPEHHCHARRCREQVPPRMLMCRGHWALVPPPLQRAVWATFRPGQERDKQPSRAYLDAARAAIEAVAQAEVEQAQAGERAGQTRVVHVQRAAYDVYVGRGMCPRTGRRGRDWSNPFSVAEYGAGGPQGAMGRYLTYMAARGDLLATAPALLRGKVLGCWCKPGPCHGDVLAILADGGTLAQARERMAPILAETRDLFA